MKYYSNWQVPLWKWLDKKQKYFDVPLNSFVEVENYEGYEDLIQVSYTNTKGVRYDGWMERRYLEPFVHALPTNCVDMSDIQTPDGSDAAQYVIWENVKQTNECGPISVAYLLGLPLSAVLSNWKTKGPNLYKRIFYGGKATGTTTSDLIQIFDLADVKAKSLDTDFKKYSPHFLKDYLVDHDVIFSCYLDTVTGRLRGSGTLHWSVIKEVTPDRQNFGWVDVYNPFGNSVERYSQLEFLGTTRNYVYGVSIPKQIQKGGG